MTMKKEILQKLSDKTLWGLAADAYERQADSENPAYIEKQRSIVYECLEIVFDRMDAQAGRQLLDVAN